MGAGVLEAGGQVAAKVEIRGKYGEEVHPRVLWNTIQDPDADADRVRGQEIQQVHHEQGGPREGELMI